MAEPSTAGADQIEHNADPMLTDESETAEDAGPPPRLMITKMVLENFKSYAGVKSIGPFHKCFSAVVGPNGSGKSNVIDAMLFVFGKRAKKLRLNKVSELIHSSDAFKDNPLEFARVSVYFQEIIDTGPGDNDFTVVPNTEIIVTRIARRDNSSTYKLDGKNCSFKHVAQYLNSKGIDLDNNRFLILQGEVEMISMMPPKGKTENDEGLLEYLEDIIGSNKYVEETNEAEAKVEALTEQRQEKLNRVKAVEKEKESLHGAKAEAEALLSKERDIRRKKNILYQINAMEVATDVAGVEEKKGAISIKLEEERAKLKEADERVAEIENGLAAQTTEYNKIHDELKRTKEEFSAYERRNIKLKEDIKHEKANMKKLESKVKAELKKEEDAKEKAATAEESIPELEEQVEECTERKTEEDAKLEKIFEEVKGVTDGLRKELEEKTQELAPVKQERSVFQAALDTAKTEVKLMEDSTNRAKKQLDAAEKELSSLDEKQSSKRAELAALEDELEESKQRVVEAEAEEKALAEKEKALAKRNTELTALAEESKAAMQASGSRSKAVAGILKAARKGGELSKVGILGRLGDLASIAEKYDVAVSTACGMLDHIVVQTTAGAQRCLDFLRKYGLGRANFIPLDKMKKGAHDRAIETPENAPRLFDLITPGNFAVAPALYLAVGNTLVAPDLETATRWAYEFSKRWRVVTIDGKLIETSGTMAGGGKSVRKGGMRLSNSKKGASSASVSVSDTSEEDCRKLEAQAQEALEELQKCRSSRRALAEEVRTLNKRIKTLSVKIPKLSMEIAGCDTTRSELTERIPELREQSILSAEDAQKVEDLKEKVEKCKSDMASCAKLASKLEAEVAGLQKSILDAGGPKLKKQQTSCEKALDELNTTIKTLNSAKVTVTSATKASAKAKKAKEQAEKDLEECESLLEKKTSEFENLTEEAKEVMEAYENVKEIELEKRTELEAVSKECEDLKKSQSKIKCVEIELVGQIENFDKQLTDCEKKVRHWESEIIKLHKAEDQDDEYDFSDDESEDEAEEDEVEEDEIPMDADGNMTENNDVDMQDADGTPKDNEVEESAKEKKLQVDKSSLPTFPSSALEQFCREEVKRDIAVLEKERDTLAKNANMGAIEEYRKKEADYLSRIGELDEVTEERNKARRAHEELRRLRLEKFMNGFGQITVKLKEMYQMITLGGDAELELVDSLDPFSEGIVFSVRPPKKSWKNIANLSGGEKTLSSLALVFALHHYKPTPLYVMDEIDAALDFKNVSIVANYIKERTKNAQFIIISLRNNMFELADRLVGIYKTNNCTKSMTINPRAFGKCGQQNGVSKRRSAPFNDRTNMNDVNISGEKRRESVRQSIAGASETA